MKHLECTVTSFDHWLVSHMCENEDVEKEVLHFVNMSSTFFVSFFLARFIPFGVYVEGAGAYLLMGEGRVHPWMSWQLILGPMGAFGTRVLSTPWNENLPLLSPFPYRLSYPPSCLFIMLPLPWCIQHIYKLYLFVFSQWKEINTIKTFRK